MVRNSTLSSSSVSDSFINHSLNVGEELVERLALVEFSYQLFPPLVRQRHLLTPSRVNCGVHRVLMIKIVVIMMTTMENTRYDAENINNKHCTIAFNES